VIHRDLKPPNILNHQGEYKIGGIRSNSTFWRFWICQNAWKLSAGCHCLEGGNSALHGAIDSTRVTVPFQEWHLVHRIHLLWVPLRRK
jgi:hypothetical protein